MAFLIKKYEQIKFYQCTHSPTHTNSGLSPNQILFTNKKLFWISMIRGDCFKFIILERAY